MRATRATNASRLLAPQASPRRGLLAALVRPQPLPLGLGIVVAIGFISMETLAVYWLRQTGSENSFRSLFLLGVLVVSAAWGYELSVATTLVSALVYFYFHLEFRGSVVANDFIAVAVFLPIGLLANFLGWQARLRAMESDALAQQQAALRRVATLVARGAAPAEIYPAAVAELSRGLGADNGALLQFGPDGATVVVGARDMHGHASMHGGEHLSFEGDNVCSLILREGRPARMDSYAGAAGSTAQRIRSLGLISVAGAPILVDGHVWGALLVGSARTDRLPRGTEERIADFADLVATSIANADARAELAASRARIVTAADHARQRFERDLHDGAQQRVVSLGLQLRAVEALVPSDRDQLRQQISLVVDGLGAVVAELQEISRGIHPAILSRGGLGPAIRGLARRSAIPVELDLAIDSRLPEQVEVAAYYIVAEALTNAAKHAQAAEVTVRARTEDGALHLMIADDGVGGAVVGSGSGLIGLKDRVEALAGHLQVVSPAGRGTTLVATIPLDDCPPASP